MVVENPEGWLKPTTSDQCGQNHDRSSRHNFKAIRLIIYMHLDRFIAQSAVCTYDYVQFDRKSGNDPLQYQIYTSLLAPNVIVTNVQAYNVIHTDTSIYYVP